MYILYKYYVYYIYSKHLIYSHSLVRFSCAQFIIRCVIRLCVRSKAFASRMYAYLCCTFAQAHM